MLFYGATTVLHSCNCIHVTAFMYFKEYSICSFLNIYTPLFIIMDENIKKKGKNGEKKREKLYQFPLFLAVEGRN